MQFLVLSHTKPGATDAQVGEHIAAEIERAWSYYLTGIIRQIFARTAPAAPGAVLVIEAEQLTQAQELMDQMPLARAGLATFEVIPIGPFAPWNVLMSKIDTVVGDAKADASA
ncbi:YciI family protein [Fodinicola feengrottensis]|nr:YciI family protein [Fodinicola feengrottensis]